MSDIQHAIDLQRRAISLLEDTEPVLQSPYYYDLGNMLIMVEDHTAAIEAYKKCSELNPNHALAFNNHAFLLSEQLNSPEQALPVAKEAYSISPDNPSVLDTIGWINFRLGNIDKAEEFIRRSVSMQEEPGALVHLAHVLVEKGDLDQALNGPLRRAEELQPDQETQAEIDRLLADIRTRRAQGQ